MKKSDEQEQKCRKELMKGLPPINLGAADLGTSKRHLDHDPVLSAVALRGQPLLRILHGPLSAFGGLLDHRRCSARGGHYRVRSCLARVCL